MDISLLGAVRYGHVEDVRRLLRSGVRVPQDMLISQLQTTDHEGMARTLAVEGALDVSRLNSDMVMPARVACVELLCCGMEPSIKECRTCEALWEALKDTKAALVAMGMMHTLRDRNDEAYERMFRVASIGMSGKEMLKQTTRILSQEFSAGP